MRDTATETEPKDSRQVVRATYRNDAFQRLPGEVAMFETWTEWRELPVPYGSDEEPEIEQVGQCRLIPRRVRRAMARSAGNRAFRAGRELPEPSRAMRRGGVRK